MWALVSNNVVQQIFTSAQDVVIGGNHYPAQIFSLWTEAQLNAIGIYVAVYSDSAPTRFHTSSNPVGVLSGTTVNVTRTWTAPALADAQAAANAIVDQARIAACAAGTVISGIPVQTDAYSVLLIIGNYLYAVQDNTHTMNWRKADGTYISLNATQIATAAKGVMNFLQTQFTTEQTRQTAIASAASVAALETLLAGYGL